MYPSGEAYTNLMSVAFMNSLVDANMIVPTGVSSSALLFPTSLISVQLGGDAVMVGSKDQITLPLMNPSVYLTIGRTYGMERGYCGADSYVDVRAHVPFSVWSQTMATQDDMEQRLEFSRQHRQNVYSNHGLNLIAKEVIGARPRANSPITGLVVVDYRWEFFYARS
jgi:hypothetical protein